MTRSAALLLAFASCQGGFHYEPGGSTPATGNTSTGPSSQPGGATVSASDADKILADRKLDYGQALRTAALKLVGALPTLDETSAVTDQESYTRQINRYLADPRFMRQMVGYFQNMMRLGGARDLGGGMSLPRDTAPIFAAELVVEDRPMTELFTASGETCPAFDDDKLAFGMRSYPGRAPTRNCMCADSGAFRPCGEAVGVLTDPGAMELYASNLAFRRARWVQETFVCTKFPAEFSQNPVPMGNGAYTSPWPFASVPDASDPQKSHVNFQDTSSVVCANCHSTLNHVAPLFANFDALGTLTDHITVKIPQGAIALATDWLPDGESTAWRFGKPAASLKELGQAMAADDDVIECQVARAWNWAMDKLDIVNDAAVVPPSNLTALKNTFVSSGYDLKSVLRAAFTHDDFVRF